MWDIDDIYRRRKHISAASCLTMQEFCRVAQQFSCQEFSVISQLNCIK